jgi:hypothetical protein
MTATEFIGKAEARRWKESSPVNDDKWVSLSIDFWSPDKSDRTSKPWSNRSSILILSLIFLIHT